MDRLGIFYWDGFSGSVSRRFNPATYALDLHYPGEATEGPVRKYDKVLQLFKLHGSINWRRSDTVTQNPYGVVFDTRPIPTEPQVKDSQENSEDLLSTVFNSSQRLAILPTAAKYGESLPMPFAHLFRAMAQALQEPQTVLFVLGYSGWDTHINQVIQDALTNPGFTCVIIDPSPTDWARNLTKADFCGRIYSFGGEWGKFEFFAAEIMPDLEVLRTDIEIARTLKDLRQTDVAKSTGVDPVRGDA